MGSPLKNLSKFYLRGLAVGPDWYGPGKVIRQFRIN